ncbi:MAG TPA: ABC transporter permease [Gammaproteobacteria bacterium]|nr:ABC transporter permease [Gammaproteobacteria bacterium]
MYLLMESLRSAFAAIRAHGLRSFLTALGIIIGVASVIAVVSIVQGLSHTVNAQFQGLGSNSITIRSFTPFEQQMQGRLARLTVQDLNVIRHRIEGISHVTPILYSPTSPSMQVTWRAKSTATRVFGVGASYMDVNQIFPGEGRFFTPSDDERRRLVCLVGVDVVENLEIKGSPLGEFIRIGNDWCRIVGVMEARGELLGFSQDDYILLPFNTMHRLIGASRELDIQIQLLVDDIARMDETIDRIRRLLRQQHELKRGEADDFRVQTAEQLTESFNAIVNTITAVAGGIVGISLLVGGIGIMNIMLVSVTERTREIGILKALGARRADILLQFLIEAVVLCLLGGIIGIAFGYGVGALVSMMLPGFPPAHVPLWAILLSVGFSAAVGIVFGILPAAKAAQLDPIESLRYE